MKVLNQNLGIVLSLITIILILIGPVRAITTMNNDIIILSQKNKDIVIDIDNIEDRLIILERIATGSEVSLYNIEKDISEIKNDIRDVRDLIR